MTVWLDARPRAVLRRHVLPARDGDRGHARLPRRCSTLRRGLYATNPAEIAAEGRDADQQRAARGERRRARRAECSGRDVDRSSASQLSRRPSTTTTAASAGRRSSRMPRRSSSCCATTAAPATRGARDGRDDPRRTWRAAESTTSSAAASIATATDAALAGAALREDALRQRPARERLPDGIAGDWRRDLGRRRARDSRRRAPDLQAPEGAFWAAVDADDPGEGTYYTWTPDEISAVLTPDQRSAVETYYGVDAAGNLGGRYGAARRPCLVGGRRSSRHR